MNFSSKQNRILSIFLASIAVFLIGSGLIMNAESKPIIHTKYTVTVSTKKVAETQAKTDEIKVKNIEIEINNPLSVDVKDYLEDVEKLSDSTIKSLKLDTSLVNINQAGSYKYTIIFNKKKYLGTIKVKEKELPSVTLTLKTISIKTKDALSSNPRTFLEGEIPDEVYNNLTLDISKVDTENQGDYTYYIIYKGVTYQGKVEVRDPGPTIITPSTTTKCPDDAKLENNTCKCIEPTMEYDSEKNKCKIKTDQ